MTTLVINELSTTLEQSIRLSKSVRYQVAAILPYIYMHNSPAGTFTISVLRGVTVVGAKTFTSDEIKAELNTTVNFAHVFHPVIFDSPFFLDAGVYTIKLSHSGYSRTSSSFIGWIQQHENLNNQLDYIPNNDSEKPLAIRLKVNRIY